MYDRKDIILAVDYHAENTEVRWLDCATGEERCLRIPTRRGSIDTGRILREFLNGSLPPP